MAQFGSLAPPGDDDWREREALEGLAAQQDANQPSGFATMWQAIRHPSLYPMYKALTTEPPQQQTPPDTSNLPDVGAPAIPSGPQISSGTKLGQAVTTTGENLMRGVGGAIQSGATLPHDVMTGEEPIIDPRTGRTSERAIGRAVDMASLAGGGSVATALERAAVNPGVDARILGRKLFSDTGQPGMAVAAAEHAPQWSTTIEPALARIPSNELTGQQWANQLKRYGAKPEELDWRGLGMELNHDIKLQRSAIEGQLANNPVNLQTIERANPDWKNLNSDQQHWVLDQWNDRGGRQFSGYDSPEDYYNAMGRAGGSSLGSDLFPKEARFQDYTIPGAENYRERLITMPPTEEPRFGFFHNDHRILPETDFANNEAARQYAVQARAAGDTSIPNGTTLRQINDIPYFARPQGSHWDEPNVLFHRRTSDREFEQPLTPEQEAQNQSRDRAIGEASLVRQQQGAVVQQINAIRRAHDARIRQDYLDGRIDAAAVRRNFEQVSDIPEMKPLQDQLGALRAKEDDILRNAPRAVDPDRIRSLHDEEAQSDWHQLGAKAGYDTSGGVPDAPFKGTGWERLAAYDQLREAAEKGYPRVSWTAGEESPTNPIVMMRQGGRSLSDFAENQQRQMIQADKGLRDYYNRRRVDQFNKIGKMHGAKVERSSLPNEGGMSGGEAMERLGIDPAHRENFWENLNDDPHSGILAPSGDLKGQSVTRDSFIKAARDKGLATYHMDIPDSLRRELLTKPTTLFSDTGEAAKAAALAQHLDRPYGSWQEALEGRHGGAEVHRPTSGAPETTGGDVPGGAGGVGGDTRDAEAHLQAQRAAGKYSPLPGLPTKPVTIGDIRYVPGPNARAKYVAEKYMQDRPQPGQLHAAPEKYYPVDPEHSTAIAQAYEDMKHEPDNPAVRASFEQMYKETLEQYRAIRKYHPEMQFLHMPPGGDPYAINPRLVAKDVAENNRMYFYPTEQGFGTSAQEGIDMATHPAMRPSGEMLNGRPLLNNDLFRIVHDYFGHIKEGYGFRAPGEDNAWRSHAAMYSDLARPAMTSETRGQNSWVNYGPHAEHNRTASGADTKYADQKMGLMPEWTMRDRGSPEPQIAYRGSPSAHAMVDMSKIGTGEGSGVRGHGMYSAEAEPIAKRYRVMTALRQDPLLKKYKINEFDADLMARDLMESEGDHAPVVEELQNYLENLQAKRAEHVTSGVAEDLDGNIKRTQRMIKYLNDPNRAKGHMYEVAHDRPPEQYLHWDKPLKEQSDYVRQQLQPMIESMDKRMKAAKARLIQNKQARLAQIDRNSPFSQQRMLYDRLEDEIRRHQTPTDWENMPGEKLYEMAAHEALGTPPVDRAQGYPLSSQYLRAKGLAGVKYQAGKNFGVPPGAEGTHNYVSFYPERILKRYALPGMLGGAGAGASILYGRGEDNGS
jgi:hypothetical protein